MRSFSALRNLTFSKQEKKAGARGFYLKALELSVIFVIGSVSVIAQTKSFEFINLPGNATLSALGGLNVSSANQNVNFFQSNPALAGVTTNGWGFASYLFYFVNIVVGI